MTEEQTAKLTREQLYNEIWEISVAGVAKKYNAPYNEMLKLCKEADIPIPPSGYWMQLSFGKPVTKIPLPESSIFEVTLPTNSDPKRIRRSAAASAAIDEKMPDQDALSEKQAVEEVSDHSEESPPPVYRAVNGEHNAYNREKLYKEVWEKPVVEVAVQYGVSDVAIHKICKSLNIPVPPRGYWAKVRAGVKIDKTPLPKAKGATEIVGARTFEGVKVSETPSQRGLIFARKRETRSTACCAGNQDAC